MNYQPGDRVVVAFPFTDGMHAKQRPALVVIDSGNDDVVVARITTKLHQTSNDLPLSNWRESGLLAPSVVRVHKLATIDKRMIRSRIGSLPSVDRQSAADILKRIAVHLGP